ncbi:eIF2A-related protein [Scytonema sp. NUACC26]|uniref:nSTAND1 domain-containing NTPase n=1 Tax=Scytonema sp. NUACC26 TaxID=3140176 RepID=UPI0034DC98D5
MVAPLESCLVRIYAKSGNVIGGGLLVSPNFIITCAHVISTALGLPEDSTVIPDQTVLLDFPLLEEEKQLLEARVVFWRPCNPNDKYEDIAGLELKTPVPAEATPMWLLPSEDLSGHHFQTCGFPFGEPNGAWATGVLRGRTAKGWVQLEDVKQQGFNLEPGFSGAPIWDDTLGRVVGIAVEGRYNNRPEAKVGFMIPAKILVAAWDKLWERPCPYRGLFAFQEEHEQFFFGREAFTKQLVEAVQQEPLVTILGPSGSGKSSVVFAGLIPQLKRQGNWRIASFRPGDRPFYALATALIPLLEPQLQGGMTQMYATRKLTDELRSKTNALRDVIETITKEASDRRLLLVVDQFEELYTLCKEQERQSFLEQLLEVVGVAKQRILDFALVLTLRADFLGYALSDRSFADFIRDGDQMLGPMNRQELEEAIIKPATMLGVVIEKGLTERLLDDVGNEPGQLPLLEFALTQLWEKQRNAQMTNAAYDEIKVKNGNVEIRGVKAALAHYAEGVYKELKKEEKERIGKLIASGSDDNTAIIWQRDGKLLKSLEGHKGHVNRVKFSPDNKLIATVSDGDSENVKLWAIDGTLLTTFNGYQDRVKDLSFSQDGKILATSSWDNTIRLWNLVGLFPKTLEGHKYRVMDVAWSPDGQTLASASWDKTVQFWNRDGAFLNSLKHKGQVNGVSFSPDDRFIATVDSSGILNLWRRDGTLLKTLKEHKDYIRAVTWSPDSQILATVGGEKDRTVKVWSREGQLLKTLKGHTDGVYGVSFSPDSKTIASSSKDNTVKLWNREGQLLKTLKGHTGWIWNVTFSPDGQIIASASEDNTVILWYQDGTLIKTLKGHTARVSDVTFSPDGKLIVTGSSDATIKFWNLDGLLLATLEEHKDRVMSVSFSPNGKTLASTSVDGAVKLWNLKDVKLTSDINVLLVQGCHWASNYLRTNQKVEKSARRLCS